MDALCFVWISLDKTTSLDALSESTKGHGLFISSMDPLLSLLNVFIKWMHASGILKNSYI